MFLPSALLILFVSAAIVCADEPALTPTISPPAATLTPTTVKTGANLRAGPGTNYPRIGSANPGQVIEIVARNPAGDWYNGRQKLDREMAGVKVQYQPCANTTLLNSRPKWCKKS